MNVKESNLEQSVKVIRLVGYILFALSSLDAISLFFPPAFFNPVWELQIMSRLVDSVPVPLISLVMIFFVEQANRLRIEKQPLRFLSWFCLFLAIFHFAMLPLGLGNTWRVNNRNDLQIGSALSQQTLPLQNVQTRLNQTNSEEDLKKIISGLVQANPNQTPTVINPKVIRERMLTEISVATKKYKADSDAAKLTTFQNLIKASIKLNLGTVAAAIAYFFLWRSTGWARITRRKNNRKSENKESKLENG